MSAIAMALWMGAGVGMAAGLRAMLGSAGKRVGDALDVSPGPEPAKGPTDAPIRLDYRGAKIWIRATTDLERRYRAHSCRKEPWTVRWLEEHVRPGEVVYDIGANVGTFTLIAAVARDALVVAFEPGYANYARLCENIALNGCSTHVIPVPLPLADANGVVRFFYRSVDPGQSRHRMEAEPVGRVRPERRLATQAMCGTCLDDARTHFALPPPAHIKLDVDGAELRVLRGAAETLRLDSVRTVLVEIDQPLWDDVKALLAEAGFEPSADTISRAREAAPLYALFVRRHEVP